MCHRLPGPCPLLAPGFRPTATDLQSCKLRKHTVCLGKPPSPGRTPPSHQPPALPCPALPGGGVPASWAGPSGTFSYRCLSAGTHLWSRCACSGTSEGTNIPFDLAICFCLCNASWRTFSSARKGRSLSKHCIALYSRGLRPPGSRLPPVQGLLGTRWHSRR